MDKVEFIEKYFDIEFLDYQKEVIKKLLDANTLNPQLYILPSRHWGKTNYRLLEAILEWDELNESKN